MRAIAAFFGFLALALMMSLGGANAMSGLGAKASDHPDWEKAVAAVQSEDYQAALPLLANVIKSEPENPDAQNLTGFAHRMLKNYEMAFSHYARALELDPKHKGAHEYIGISYLETDQLEKAEETLVSLKKLCAFCPERRSLDSAVKSYKRANKSS